MNIEPKEVWVSRDTEAHCIVEAVDSKIVTYTMVESGNKRVASKRSFLTLYKLPNSSTDRPYTIFNVGIGIELDKRQNLENTIIADICKKCNHTNVINLGRIHYLSYPVIGKQNTSYYWCEECGEDCRVEYKLEMKITVY